MKPRAFLLGGILATMLSACVAVLCLAQAPRPATAGRPQLWTIIVGIDNYVDPAIPDSKQDVRNANALLSWFRQTAGWEKDHCLLLSDFGSHDPRSPQNPAANILPTRANFDWAFQVWLRDKVKPGDLVVFYYAGQMAVGSPAKSPEGRPEYYLLPIDGSRADPESTGWALDRALDQLVLRNEGKCRVLCWLGTSVRSSPESPQPAASPRPGTEPRAAATTAATGAAAREWLRRLTRWPGVSSWLAADHDPAPGAGEPATLFTATILKGLGEPKLERNVAACLNTLQQEPRLKRLGFQALGGVSPELNLWPSQFGRIVQSPRPEMVFQVGHADKVTGLAVSADGRLAITSSMDSTIRAWSLDEHALLRVLTGHSVGVTSIALSADGRWLASGGGRKGVLVHDLTNDYAVKLVLKQPHEARVAQVVFLPGGTRFLSVDQSAQAFLWDLTRSPLQPEPWLREAECREVTAAGDAERGAVAALCGDGAVRLYDAKADGGVMLKNLPARATTVALAPDCQQVAVGLADGRLVVRNLETKRDSLHRLGTGKLKRLAYSRAGQLAVVQDDGVWMFPADPALAQAVKLTDQPGAEIAFSPEGGKLALCTENSGELLAWKVDGEGPPQSLYSDHAARACTLAFSGDGNTILWGCFDGAVRTRNLQPQGAGEAASWQFPAHRGKVQRLSVAPNRQFMLLVNELNQALVWDLKGRICRLVPGAWSAGAFLDNDRMVLACAPDAADRPGQLTLVDRNTLAVQPAFFHLKEGEFQVPPAIAFETLAVSRDGTHLAAATSEAQTPLVCVWDTRTGQLANWIDQIEDTVQSLSFSPDTGFLATAGDSPAIQVWKLDSKPPARALEHPHVTLDNTPGAAVTCVEIRPPSSGQLVSGHRDGSVVLWTYGDRKAGPVRQTLVEGMFDGAVKALRFQNDGNTLAAAGDSTEFWLGRIAPGVERVRALDAFRPHHFEQINALEIPSYTKDEPPLLFTGSDDTTVRIWDLQAHKLLGTFSANTPEKGPPAAAGALEEQDWVLYAPDGRFDSSAGGRRLVRYRGHGRARPMDQFDGSLYTFQLGEQLRTGTLPREGQPLAEPPPVAIEPVDEHDPAQPEGRLIISVGAANVHDLRLYQNDVPIPLESEQQKDSSVSRFTARVHLLKGVNRFYVMAGRDGAYDSRSPEVELAYNGPAESRRVHVIALGVGDYARRRLNFPGRDAERISQVLNERGRDAGGQPGMRIVLADETVNGESVKEAFHQVQTRVKGRPQDTVVVFLAGHTGVFDADRFCLLLSRYPFPKDEPRLVAMRDAAPALAPGARLNPEDVLPFSQIAQNLMGLDALNRLVIVDACQAEAILSDPKVTAIQKWMEIGTRRARTSYLMAARRGEPALEVEPLSHGLFTYTLLLGMRAIVPEQEPKEIRRLELPPDADADGDGAVSTAELDAYVKHVMPTISAQFPALVASRRDAVARPQSDPADLEQKLRLQSAETSFRLIPLRDPPRSAQP